MDIIDSSKSILENLYYLSGILVLISIFIGIWQLVLTKKTLLITSQRSAADLSAKQIEIYFDKIVPLQNDLFELKFKNKIDDLEITPGEFNKEYLITKLGNERYFELHKLHMPIMIDFLRMANAMEAFAVYFVKGVADEEIAYSSVGRTFCSTIESYYFEIASLLKKEDNRHWSNLINLYDIWSKRLKSEKLAIEKDIIESQLKDFKNIRVSPIGTV